MQSAHEIVFTALARGLAPDELVEPVEWAENHLILPDGPYQGQKWVRDHAPYWVEVLNLLSSSSPETIIAVRKSAQVGFTQIALAWLGYIVDISPADTLVVFPNIKSLNDFNRVKLHRSFSGSPRLRRKVVEQKSRSADGSTTTIKQFPGGAIVLTWSSSTADLRSKTVKNAFCDEVDEWPKDLDGQGDPMAMVDARQKSFHDTGEYKKLVGSTPTIKKISRIDAVFEAGDQRFWQVPCPHCREFQRLVFASLKFEPTYPHNARYACGHCGALIEHHEKKAMVRAGKWVATAPGPGRHPSFHIDALSSLLTTWDKIAEEFVAAKDDPAKLKAFVNLTLGEAWEARGDAPESERLYALREDYEQGVIPHGGLVITGAADVQKTGIYYETLAWGVGETNWSIETGFLPGDTADPHDQVWKALDAVRGRQYPDAYGNRWPLDAFGIDANYNADAVYAWLRRWPQHNTFALQGRPGWGRPPLMPPESREVSWDGKKKRRGLKVWGVGIYDLKAKLYAALRKKGIKEGEELDPAGYCHFSREHDLSYFQQLVAEQVKEKKNQRGYVEMIWERTGENHFHDCRIYNMALAAHLGVGRLTDEQWAQRAAIRNVPPEKVQGDLFAPLGRIAPPPPGPKPKPMAAQQTESPQPRRPDGKPRLNKRNNFLKR